MRTVCREQNCAEWYSARVGKIGASNIHKAMAFLKRASGDRKAGESSKERDDYILELATELITRVPMEHYVSPAMDHGTTYEPEARIEYWQLTGNDVDQTGFVLHPTLDYAGASPDGLLTPDGGIEMKCPMLKTHMSYLCSDEIPQDYQLQMQFNMMCCERSFWDFVSYVPPAVYPEVPERFRLYIKRLQADLELHRAMTEACVKTMDEAARLVTTLDSRCPERTRKPEQIDADDMEWLDRIHMTP